MHFLERERSERENVAEYTMSNRSTASNNEEGEGTRMAMLTPYRMGPFQLSHRVVLSALTRRRSYNHLPQPHAILYYTQRTSPGALLISEATIISHTALGCLNCPGVWSDEQVAAWKPIVQAVHDKGGIFFCQLWHAGRCSSTDIQPNGQVPVSSTNRKVSGSGKYSAPRVLRTEEISMIVTDFRVAARNAVKAGFDGVEIQGAYGFLLDQFMKDGVNDRTDMYGGSLENRCRFTLEVMKEIADEIGSQCVGIRLSPFTDHEDAIDSDPKALGLYMANALSSFNILYAHFVAPRMRNVPIEEEDTSLVPMREAFKGTFMAGGGFNCENGNMVIELGMADVVAYGRWFVSNPDLPRRFALNAPLTPYDQTTLYTSDPFVGYTDYPSLEELQTV